MSDTNNLEPSASVPLMVALVAHRYYIDDRQKSEIADEFGISRFKVARLLEEARSRGIVHIRVDLPTELDITLGDSLASTFGLKNAIVVPVAGASPDTNLAIVGAAAARYLEGTITTDDVLGMSWGTSLTNVINAVEALPSADIVQLVGGVRSADIEDGGVELLRRLASKSSGKTFPLHAPLLVRTPETAQALREDPSLAESVGKFAQLTVALVGIGSWAPPKSSLYAEIGSAEREDLLARGATADVCTFIVNPRGALVASDVLDCSIGISEAELRAVPRVVAVAAGLTKVSAITAALRSGLITTLVTDSVTAAAVLNAQAR